MRILFLIISAFSLGVSEAIADQSREIKLSEWEKVNLGPIKKRYERGLSEWEAVTNSHFHSTNSTEPTEPDCSQWDKCPTGKTQPICDTNGVTYPNLCKFNQARCLNPNLEQAYEDDCKVSTNECRLELGCSIWFDGCNYCVCDENGSATGCTNKHCPDYEKPRCHLLKDDHKAFDQASPSTSQQQSKDFLGSTTTKTPPRSVNNNQVKTEEKITFEYEPAPVSMKQKRYEDEATEVEKSTQSKQQRKQQTKQQPTKRAQNGSSGKNAEPKYYYHSGFINF